MRKRGKPNVELIIREYNKGLNAEQIAAMDWCEVKAPTVLNILKKKMGSRLDNKRLLGRQKRTHG